MDERNHGIDLIKIISMLMIIILHVLGKGGMLDQFKMFSLRYEAVWLLESLCYCAVNCYALASGYLMYQRKYSYHKIVALWFQVLFYSFGITMLFKFYMPEVVGRKMLFFSLTPVISSQYWYFTAYAGLFLFIPFLNRLIDLLSKKELQVLLLTGFMLFSVATVCNLKLFDPFSVGNGYTIIWLSYVYLIGCYIKKFKIGNNNPKNYCFLFGYLFFSVITWLSKYLSEWLTVSLLGSPQYNRIFVAYNSPTILGAGLCLFLFIKNIKIKNQSVAKILTYLASISFGVYLIHDHPLMQNVLYYYTKFLRWGKSAIFVLVCVIVYALVIYVGCSVIDGFRKYLFKKIKINVLSQKITAFFGKKINCVLNKFN